MSASRFPDTWEGVCGRLDARKMAIPGELHPELRARLLAVLRDLEGRLTPWCGFRDKAAQLKAKRDGNSNAGWLESPHNYRPALAVDLVLDPRRVRVGGSEYDGKIYPNLWDKKSPEAAKAWADLESAAVQHHLHRVTLPGGRRDLPHLELPGWGDYVGR